MERKGQKLEQLAELVRPSLVYKDSFIAAIKEFQAEGRKLDLNLEEINENFYEYLAKIDRDEKGESKKDRVPQSEFWLTEGNEFIGRTSVRHYLINNLLTVGGHIGYDIRPSQRKKGYGTRILKLALEKAKALRIDRVLLTCDDDNIGSAKIIESNGGILENKV